MSPAKLIIFFFLAGLVCFVSVQLVVKNIIDSHAAVELVSQRDGGCVSTCNPNGCNATAAAWKELYSRVVQRIGKNKE